MKKKFWTNAAVFVLLTAIPVIAEIVTATPTRVPGMGFSVLLYEPFDFAYILLAATLFTALNGYLSYRSQQRAAYGFGIGLILSLLWSVAAFLVVGQLHLALGGKL